MMFYMNIWSTQFLGVVILLTSEIWGFMDFVNRYPTVVNDVIWFSVLSALGQVGFPSVCHISISNNNDVWCIYCQQLFIFLTVAEYGPLPCSVVTTTRKFFTVLVSILYFRNPATFRQWIGTILVFTGIALDNLKGQCQYVCSSCVIISHYVTGKEAKSGSTGSKAKDDDQKALIK